MHSVRHLPWLLVALLITAALHCACGHDVSIDAQQRPHKHCHNEFGCLCHGATLAVAIDVEHGDAPWETTLLGNDLALAGSAAAARAVAPLHLAAPPPISGRALRAHLSSLVI